MISAADIFARLAEVQRLLGANVARFRATVMTIDGVRMIVIEHANPRRPFALFDAVGIVFGEATILDGCESCGYDSKIGVHL